MKTSLRLLPLLALALLPLQLAFAADDAVIAALRAADDERIAATVAGDRARLEAIFSDDLRYAHSNGKVDNKASFIEAIVSGKSDYQSITYTERNITPVAPNIALITGRSPVKVMSNGTLLDLNLSVLEVWRNENGRWRFLAWQSARIPAPNP